MEKIVLLVLSTLFLISLVNATCSYPGVVNCDTFEELNIVAQEWKDGICTFNEMMDCANIWVNSTCIVPIDGMAINETTKFCTGTYNLPNGISVGTDNIILDCNGAELIGNYSTLPYSTGINIDTKNNINIINCFITQFMNGIIVRESSNVNIINNIVYNNQRGIVINWQSNNNYFLNNSIVNNFQQGISIVNSFNNTLTRNNVINNGGGGIRIWFSPDNKIEYNNIYQNNYYDLYDDYNLFIDNILAQYNWWGIVNRSKIESSISGNITFIPFLCEPYPTNFISNEDGRCLIDSDNDEVPELQDKCPNTTLPENFIKLNPNKYGDVDGDKIFETVTKVKIGKKKTEKMIDSVYSLVDTYGCSCHQILDIKPGKDNGELKNGCSKGILEDFIHKRGWAKNLFP